MQTTIAFWHHNSTLPTQMATRIENLHLILLYICATQGF